MRQDMSNVPVKLSVVIPCFNEEQTLATCVDRVLGIQDEALSLEIILVRFASAVFLGLVAVATLSPVLRHRLRWDLGLTTLAAIVLGSSLVQALTIWGDNARYAISVQPLVLVIDLLAAHRLTASSEAILAAGSMARKGA